MSAPERPTVKPQRGVRSRDTGDCAPAGSAAPPDPWLGKQVGGRYRILSAIGAGGMGSIYLAEHLTLGRKFALKLLSEELSAKEGIRKRFEREARTLSALHHPNVVAVSDYGVDGDAPFLVMELAPGEDLSAQLEKGLATPEQAYEVFRQLLRGVAHAHAEGLVHRDLKPSNVMVRFLRDGSLHVQVLDFGLARYSEQSKGGPRLTRAGAILGTPAYMAPEQASGEGAEAPSDTYAAGLILFELLAGRRPFPHTEPTALLRAHLMEDAPILSRVATHLRVPPELDVFLSRALTKAKADRFADAGVMLSAFEALPMPQRVAEGGAMAPAVAAATVSATEPGMKSAAASARPSRSARVLGAIAAVLAAVILLGVWLTANGDEEPVLDGPGTLVARRSGTPMKRPPKPAPGAARTQSPPAAASVMDTVPLPPAIPQENMLRENTGRENTGRENTLRENTGRENALRENTGRAQMPSGVPPSLDLPETLRAAHTALERGRRLPRSKEGELIRYARAHSSDPFASLLLGRSYGNGRALSDSVGAYEEALARNADVRFDGRLQDHLLQAAVANTASLRWKSKQVLERFFTLEEIRPALERNLARASGDDRRRLQQLRADIAQ